MNETKRHPESLADFRSSDDDKRREMIALEAFYAAEGPEVEGDGDVQDWLARIIEPDPMSESR